MLINVYQGSSCGSQKVTVKVKSPVKSFQTVKQTNKSR